MLLPILFYVVLAVAAIFILGSLTTFLVERSPYHKQFIAGRAPAPLPDGFHPGAAHVLFDKQTPWLGKQFNRTQELGFNVFTPLGAKILKFASPFYPKFSLNEDGNTHAYYFKTRVGKGKKDTSLDVLKLDYAAMRENPLFIRIILDEVVEIAPQQYLGKIHVKLLPGFFVTIGYFGLTEQPQESAVKAGLDNHVIAA
ncbi:MAG TPA: hypothetical protein PLD20_07615 [Blastocatellia bacterium]|nr:hypothetical protein [Blastocatellia bacterium]HMV86828.1 hypothetical protein [Blastocatellia bacterium]HMZ17779.1 hypothetical protein [Blastocatellia bacterium]HNG30807.1 hypothetical protein [Blastocatellia bacterium]